MLTFLLFIIYLAFISLGLPDAAFGAAWPEMYVNLGVPVSYAGIFTVLAAGGTIVSSSLSGKLIAKLGTGKLTAISGLMTASGLILMRFLPGFWWLLVLAIPLGLGAGSVDAALNGFVAMHYGARHMNWLHSFWGLGATIGPLIMSHFLAGSGWRSGFTALGLIQAGLTVVLFATLPLWKKVEKPVASQKKKKPETKLSAMLALPGAKQAIASFFFYCAVEQVVGLWSSSYMVISGSMSAEKAAQYASMFFFGITAGRVVAGFIAEKLGNKLMIRCGQIAAGVGTVLMFITGQPLVLFAGLMAFGIGCAPIYPAMMFETPKRFGEENAQGIIGLEMAVAYTGSTFAPPLAGLLFKRVSFSLFPLIAMILVAAMIVTSESANRIFKNTLRIEEEQRKFKKQRQLSCRRPCCSAH